MTDIKHTCGQCKNYRENEPCSATGKRLPEQGDTLAGDCNLFNTHFLCPKCGQPMMRAGKQRRGSKLMQRWLCNRIAGCGHLKLTELEEK